jgi:hypothetical protein
MVKKEKETLDPLIMVGFIIYLSSKRRYPHAEDRRIFKAVQGQCQDATPL